MAWRQSFAELVKDQAGEEACLFRIRSGGAVNPIFGKDRLNLVPQVAGRMAAYEDGMTKLLWPEKRLGAKSVKVTTIDSKLPDIFPMLKELMPEFADLPGLDVDLLRVPKGTPINLLMNVHPKDIKAVLQAYVDGVLQGAPREQFAELRTKNHDMALQQMIAKLLEVNMCPDFIEDRGHTFGRDLSDQDKQALIEYMKYF